MQQSRRNSGSSRCISLHTSCGARLGAYAGVLAYSNRAPSPSAQPRLLERNGANAIVHSRLCTGAEHLRTDHQKGCNDKIASQMGDVQCLQHDTCVTAFSVQAHCEFRCVRGIPHARVKQMAWNCKWCCCYEVTGPHTYGYML